jgi:hypothetical protein
MVRRSIVLELYQHLSDRLVEPIGEFGDESRFEGGFTPVIEDETQIGKRTRLQEQKTIDVIFMAAQRASKVVGDARHPFLEAVEQRFTDFLATFRAAGFVQEAIDGLQGR